MTRSRLVPAAVTAATLLLPVLAAAAPQNANSGPGFFTGAGNLWGGSTRSAGAPPGCVPGEPCGAMAHHYGIAHQPYGSKLPDRWTKKEIQGAAR